MINERGKIEVIIGDFPQSNGIRFITTPDGVHRVPAIREDIDLEPFTATKTDILQGKTAFTEKGITMGEYTIPCKIATPDGRSIAKAAINEQEKTLIPEQGFGDAAAVNVVKGKTFTSDKGIKIVGTLDAIDLTLMTATDANILKGKIAYTKSGLTTGTLELANKICTPDGENVTLASLNTETNALYPYDGFGSATAAEVENGYTFTSNAGWKITGTAPRLEGKEEPERTTFPAATVTASQPKGAAGTVTLYRFKVNMDGILGIGSSSTQGNFYNRGSFTKHQLIISRNNIRVGTASIGGAGSGYSTLTFSGIAVKVNDVIHLQMYVDATSSSENETFYANANSSYIKFFASGALTTEY